ncbi:hypothetical protein [Streptomyces sp. NPDC001480]|uniref:hypothetical protein n=1 Tax=Streptomyces sp. NPDC001480 TaxID=3364577 RepID=UPI0036C5C010
MIRADAVHTLLPGQAPQRVLAVRGDRITALSQTHTRLIHAALGAHDVPVHQARTIPEFLDLIRQRARTTPEPPVPPGGVIGRDADGKLDGRLIDNALGLVERLFPAPDRAQRIAGLRLASSQYAATGIGTVRDCAVLPRRLRGDAGRPRGRRAEHRSVSSSRRSV